MINTQSSIATEMAEAKMINAGYHAESISFDPTKNKVYLGDARNYLESEDWLVDIELYNKAKVLGASGDAEKANELKIFNDKYLGFLEDYTRINNILEDTSMPYQKVLGAAGAEATLGYETIKRVGELLPAITGQMDSIEEYQAMNIAEIVTKSRLKFEFIRKTSATLTVQKQISDDSIPDQVRQAYTLGTKEIFADAIAFESSMRDTAETKIDTLSQFQKDLPVAFTKAQNDRVLAVLNGLTGNNQGDWDATSGNRYTVNAAEQMNVAETYVKQYGTPMVVIMNSDTWRLYESNLGGLYVGSKGNISTSDLSAKSGRLTGNPSLQYYLDDGVTSQSYIAAAKPSFMKLFKGPVIQTSLKDMRTAGQMDQRFYFNFNGIVETESNAQYRGTTVGA